MDIVVKIKQCLLVVFIVGTMQLVAMDSEGHGSIELSEQFAKMQNNIKKLADEGKERLKSEEQALIIEENFFKNIAQSLLDYKNSVNLMNLQKDLMSQPEYEKFEMDVAYNCLTYTNLLLTQEKRLSELQAAIRVTGSSVKVLQKHIDDLNVAEKKAAEMYELRNKNERGQKRALEINHREQSLLKKRRIVQGSSLAIKPNNKTFGRKTSQPGIRQLSRSSFNITKNFSTQKK